MFHLKSNVSWAWYRALIYLLWMPFNKMKWTVKRFLFSALFLLYFFVRFDMKQFCWLHLIYDFVVSRSCVMAVFCLKFTLIALNFALKQTSETFSLLAPWRIILMTNFSWSEKIKCFFLRHTSQMFLMLQRKNWTRKEYERHMLQNSTWRFQKRMKFRRRR